MDTALESHSRRVEQDGYTLLESVFDEPAVANMTADLERALAGGAARESALRNGQGVVVASRNVLRLWPGAATVWKRPPLPELLADLLGPSFGLVRVLFFDKPPQQTWALPWHKDLTVAVRDNRLPGSLFTHPTRKAGVPHAEAPLAVLENMLTARIHLDEVTDENGPLQVLPGSHRAGKKLETEGTRPHAIYARPGSVLLIRPLVAHASGRSHPGTDRHRRILHLEFAGSPELPDGYAWHDFLPGMG